MLDSLQWPKLLSTYAHMFHKMQYVSPKEQKEGSYPIEIEYSYGYVLSLK